MERIETGHIRRRFMRALDSYDNQAEAQHRISRKLASLLSGHTGLHFHRILEIGCGTGSLTRCLTDQCRIDEWVLNDLCEKCFEKVIGLFPDHSPSFLSGDAETLAFPGKFDLVASASVFQWMRQPEVFLHKLASLLLPGGSLLFSTFAPGNLYEIKELTGKGLFYPPADEWRRWLSRDFRMLHHEEETLMLAFSTPAEVLKHLRDTGVTATGREFWTRGRLEQFSLQYQQLFINPDNQVTLTYRPLYFLAVKKEKRI